MCDDVICLIATYCDNFTMFILKYFTTLECKKRIIVNLTIEDILSNIHRLKPEIIDKIIENYRDMIISYCLSRKTNIYCILRKNFAALKYCNEKYKHIDVFFNQDISEEERKKIIAWNKKSCKTIQSYVRQNINDKYINYQPKRKQRHSFQVL